MRNLGLHVFWKTIIVLTMVGWIPIAWAATETVVVYVSLDEMYSQPILDAFEKNTGIHVNAVYDAETSKTTGLVNRLIAEKTRPRADVYWDNEVVQMLVLKQKGVLEAYASPARGPIPPKFKDPDGYWTGIAARARVIIYNTDKVKNPPTSIQDLLKPEWSGKATIGNPLFGTTAAQAAALFVAWGDEKAKTFFRGLKENKIAVLPGNAAVRDLVARGEYAWGLTDTDDANGGIEDGFPVKWILPDQEAGGLGTLLIPNSVALIKSGPNAVAGKKLIDYLLSPEVEQRLAAARSIQIPLNPAVKAPANVPELARMRTMDVSNEAAAKMMEAAARYLQQEFLR